MRRTIRGRGARGFVEPRRDLLVPYGAAVEVLDSGVTMVIEPKPRWHFALRWALADRFLAYELRSDSPLLCMRGPRV